jgi:hypothetical protein
VVPPAGPEPAPKPPASDRERRLAQQERRLAQRQAELEAREKRLRQQEAEAAPTAPAPEAAPAAPAPEAEAAPAAPEPAPVPAPEPARPEPVTVDAGTKFDVKFDRALSSATSKVGDLFRARISQDVYVGDQLAIPGGSEVVGEVTQAVKAKRIGGKAVLGLRITDLVLPSGATVPLKASFLESGASRTGSDAATIGGAAAGGAILGRILSKGGDKGTLLGALLGAVAGTAAAAARPGEEVVIPEGSTARVVLDGPVEIVRR